MKIEDAMRYAELWRAGKLIGADEDEVRNALLAEVERLRAENAVLREESEGWWEEAHDEACTNMKDCASYGGNKECYRPRPEILKRPNDLARRPGDGTAEKTNDSFTGSGGADC